MKKKAGTPTEQYGERLLKMDMMKNGKGKDMIKYYGDGKGGATSTLPPETNKETSRLVEEVLKKHEIQMRKLLGEEFASLIKTVTYGKSNKMLAELAIEAGGKAEIERLSNPKTIEDLAYITKTLGSVAKVAEQAKADERREMVEKVIEKSKSFAVYVKTVRDKYDYISLNKIEWFDRFIEALKKEKVNS